HLVPHIEPFRMMIHGLSDQRDASHVAECRHKILALIFAVEFSVLYCPTGEFRDELGNFFVSEFARFHKMPPSSDMCNCSRPTSPCYARSSVGAKNGLVAIAQRCGCGANPLS